VRLKKVSPQNFSRIQIENQKNQTRLVQAAFVKAISFQTCQHKKLTKSLPFNKNFKKIKTKFNSEKGQNYA
jgi:hypothetical protein